MHVLESGESQGPFSPLRAIDFLTTLALPFLGHVRLLHSTPQLPPPWSSAEYTSFGPLLSLQWMLGVLLTPVSGLVGKQKPVDRPARYALGCPPCLPPPLLHLLYTEGRPHGPQAWAQLSPCRSLSSSRGEGSCFLPPAPTTLLFYGFFCRSFLSTQSRLITPWYLLQLRDVGFLYTQQGEFCTFVGWQHFPELLSGPLNPTSLQLLKAEAH